jgi:hypothetical protein
MKYKLDLSQKLYLSAPAASGFGGPQQTPFYAWQPSTWPATPATVDENFIRTLKQIFEESILSEINNVISDAQKSAGGLAFRGHVVAIASFCALDAISSYGYGARRGKQIPDFICAHFPGDFHPHAKAMLHLYRHAMIHSWNLFKASISPGHEPITNKGGISFGLLTLFDALVVGTGSFLERLESDPVLQAKTLVRYRELKVSARPPSAP